MNAALRRRAAGAGRRRIFLVEDHPITREGFARLLDFQPDLQVCGQTGTAAEALREIPRARPDLVIVDLSLAGGSGLDLLKDLALRDKNLPTLVLSTHDERLYAERALRAGARGYVMKQEPTEAVLAAVRGVLAGEICVSAAMRRQLLGRLRRGGLGEATGIARLSDRELEVFQAIGQGHGTREIARQLNVSVSTVETYRAHIKEKLALRNAMELVSAAVRWVQRND